MKFPHLVSVAGALVCTIVVSSTSAAPMSKSERTLSDYSDHEALSLAETYLEAVRLSPLTIWNGQAERVDQLTRLYGHSDRLVGYEATVLSSAGDTLGFFVLNADRDRDIVDMQSDDDNGSMSELLRNWAIEIGADVETAEQARIFMFGPFDWFIELPLEAANEQLLVHSRQYGDFIYASPDIHFTDEELDEALTARPGPSGVRQERSENRDLLETGDIASLAGRLAPKASSARTALTPTPPDIRQVSRLEWNWSILCYSGCVPASWTIIYAWWDNSGYSRMVGGSTPINGNNGDVDATQWYINDHHTATGCDGYTNVGNVIKGLYYTNNSWVNYPEFTAAYCENNPGNSAYDCNMWDRIVDQIEHNRPPMIGYPVNSSGGHAVVPYQYWYDGSNNKWLRVRTNGYGPTDIKWNAYPQEQKAEWTLKNGSISDKYTSYAN